MAAGGRAGKLLGLLGIGNTTTLRLATLDPECVAGGRVRVRAGVHARRTVEVRSARVTLERVVRADRYDVSVAPGWRGVAVPEVLAAEEFLGPGPLEAGADRDAELTFDIPADAPPSGAAERLAVRYILAGRLELADALDVATRVQVRVLSPRAMFAALEGTRVVSAAAPEPEHVDIELARLDAAPGQTIEGRVLVAAGSGSGARVDVALRRWERSSYESGRRPAIDREVAVASQSLAAGDAGFHSFALTVPADACPTIVLPRSAVRWLVRATLAPDRGGEESVAVEVNVHTG